MNYIKKTEHIIEGLMQQGSVVLHFRRIIDYYMEKAIRDEKD